MRQRFDFPDEKFVFGKYVGRTISDVMNADKAYVVWAINNSVIKVSQLIVDWSNGIDVQTKYVTHKKVSPKGSNVDLLIVHYVIGWKVGKQFKVIKSERLLEIPILLKYDIVTNITTRKGCDNTALLLEDKFYEYAIETLHRKYDTDELHNFTQTALVPILQVYQDVVVIKDRKIR